MYREGEPHVGAAAEITDATAASAGSEPVSVAELGADPAEPGPWARAGWGAALAGVAAVAKWADYKGISHGIEAPERWMVDSAAHPIIGYAGAWAAEAASRRRHPMEAVKASTAWLGATVANFVAEGVQSVTVATPQFAAFWSSSNRLETGRDYAGAMLGMAFFVWRDRRQR